MSDEKETVKVEPGSGNFGDCLVEGSAEARKRGRKNKRRAIAISVALESLGLTALVFAPMLAKPAELVVQNSMPMPPYRRYVEQRHVGDRTLVRPARRSETIFQPTSNPPRISAVDHSTPLGQPPGPDDLPFGPGNGQPPDGLILLTDPRDQHVVPPPPPDKKRVVVGHIDAAMLVDRVEPVFPAILKQLHRSGKVELHALIATDGTIQSLQVVSGDPLCVQSALDAVRRWRYRPTLLNGQPVEVDTFITVIYTTQQQ